MATFKNTAQGARGINLKSGSTVWVEAGASVEVDEKDVAKVHPDLAKPTGSQKKASDKKAD